ncbi:MAG: hypothetical protein RMJ87_09330 [Cytophagales bacterium]|nr:hypothetical protein [Bernardetiaceae bacterium]MDW8205217.1 hypothetical protein [Cytophagales bacterium]
MKGILCLSLICFVAISCRQSDELKGFDRRLWQSDPLGCQSKRVAQTESFLQVVKPYLLQNSLGEMQVRALLGKADAIEIAERGMKFYRYYLTRGRQCLGDTSGIAGQYIQIRFNALNQVNEVALIISNL